MAKINWYTVADSFLGQMLGRDSYQFQIGRDCILFEWQFKET